MGAAKARELFYLSDRIDSEEALRLGLTNWVCEPEELSDKSREIATRLASGPPVALRYLKENINRALNNPDFGECMDLEATNMARCRDTQDHQNAVRAFLARGRTCLHRTLGWPRGCGRTRGIAGFGRGMASPPTVHGTRARSGPSMAVVLAREINVPVA